MKDRFRKLCYLHNHSMFSMLDAVPSVKEWCWWCLDNGVPGFSVTDHGTAISMYDATRFPKFIQEYNKKNGTNHPDDAVIGVPGVELYVKLNPEDKGHYHICAWATSNEGYYNLMKLASEAYNDVVKYHGVEKPRTTYETILKYRKGIKFGTACIGSPMGMAIIKSDYALAEKHYKMYIDMFGDDFYTEFHVVDYTHNYNRKTGGFDPIPHDDFFLDGNKQKTYNLFLRDMIEKYGGKPIAATDAHFLYKEDHEIQSCLLRKGNTNGWTFHQSYHQRTTDEIFDMLKGHLGDWMTEDRFNEMIDNTHEVMNLAKDIKITNEYSIPRVQIPDHIKAKTDNYDDQTLYYTMERIKKHGRWVNTPEYIERFKKEIDVIKNNDTMNFLPYFLLYEDIGSFARENGILQGIARGSAGGSLLSYYLKIIHIDPIEADLPFERFLSHARIKAGSWPDIDSDFGNRKPIVKFLKEKYGLGFAQITTYDTMKVKSAIYDSMWSVYKRNRNDPEIKQLCKSIPDSPQGIAELDFLYGYTDKEGQYHKGEIEKNDSLNKFFKQYPDIKRMVDKLVGVTCKMGRHASGFVVCSDDIAQTKCPTFKVTDKATGEDLIVTQYDGKRAEDVGLVKADILGVVTINVVSDAIKMIKDNGGEDYLEEDKSGTSLVYRLPEDRAVYSDFFKKKTDSSFQFNTSLVKNFIPQFAPTEKKDLAILTALVRPGALDAPLLDSTATQYYIDVKNGRRDLEYVHPDLEKYTGETNGVFAFQEQILTFLVDFCGYSLEESDQIRAAIAKKKHEVMMKAFDKIRQAAAERGWTKEQAETICQQIMAFSRYSFNKSHSRAYGDTGYITMFLKHHHPIEWWTSVLNNTGDEDKIRHYMSLLGETIRPPSLEHPSNTFTMIGDKIITPVSAIKKIGPSAADELNRVGKMLTIEDFMEKINHRKVNVGHFCHLVDARACDHMMDLSKPYIEARLELFQKYIKLKKIAASKIKEEMVTNYSQLEIFMKEREVNTCFNKTILSDPEIKSIIMDKFKGLKNNDNELIPLRLGSSFILANISVAERFLQKGYDKSVGLILIFDESSIKSGVSKKSGRNYSFLKVKMSDGFKDIEATQWNVESPLRFKKNSLVYVKGKIKKGWKGDIEIDIKEIEPIESITGETYDEVYNVE